MTVLPVRRPKPRSSKYSVTATMAYSVCPTNDIQLSGMKFSMNGSPASDANRPRARTQVITPQITPVGRRAEADRQAGEHPVGERVQRDAGHVVQRLGGRAAGVDPEQVLEQAEGYRARVVNEALGEASRFSAILAEYVQAPDVTRKRIYLETLEGVLSDVDIIMMD